MIGMAAKDSEEKSTQKTQRRSQVLRQEFWTKTLQNFREHDISLYANISPSTNHYLTASSGVSGCIYGLIFGSQLARVELYLRRTVAHENKAIFDRLLRHKTALDTKFGVDLHWQRLDQKKACRISFAQSFDGYDRENWPKMIDWLGTHIVKLQETFSEPLREASQDLKTQADPDP